MKLLGEGRATGLPWSGAARPTTGAGMVTEIGLNAARGPRLAVDPEGTVPLKRTKPAESGPALVVEPLAPAPEEGPAVSTSGRFRIPRG